MQRKLDRNPSFQISDNQRSIQLTGRLNVNDEISMMGTLTTGHLRCKRRCEIM